MALVTIKGFFLLFFIINVYSETLFVSSETKIRGTLAFESARPFGSLHCSYIFRRSFFTKFKHQGVYVFDGRLDVTYARRYNER